MAERLKDSWVRKFQVTDPTRHPKGFTVYKVVSTVFPKSFPDAATKITVWKRYKDFKNLHKELSTLFYGLYLKGDFPQLPKDKYFKRFDPLLIEERRKCALDMLEFAASYPQLFMNTVFVKFFEDGYSRKDLEGNGIGEEKEPPGPSVLVEEEDRNWDDCLVPERVWSEMKKPEEDSSPSFSDSPTDSKETTPMHHSVPPSHRSEGNEPIPSTSKSTVPMPMPNVVTFTDNSSQGSQLIHIPVSKSGVFPPPAPYSLQDMKLIPSLGSSTSLSEELDLLDEEFEFPSRVSLLPSSASLENLNEQSETTPSSVRNKYKGFNLFDFLPIFTKKQDKTGLDLSESLTSSYLREAAGFFTVAQNCESSGDFEAALDSYTEGIRILLEGAHDDADEQRKGIVKNKVAKYLSHAEILKQKLQLGDSGALADRLTATASSTSGASLSDDGSFVMLQSNVMPSDMEELKNYKIVGCTDNVLVGVDVTAQGGPDCFAIKVLRKSSSPLDPEKPSIIPGAIPFMVQLLKWFSTDDVIVLVLKYAGGRLMDFAHNYQTKEMLSPSPSSEQNENKEQVTKNSNVLSPELQDLPPDARLQMMTLCVTEEENSSAPKQEYIMMDTTSSIEQNCNDADNVGIPLPSTSHADLPTDALIENSRALLQMVSKTLDEQRKTKEEPNGNNQASCAVQTCDTTEKEKMNPKSPSLHNDTTTGFKLFTPSKPQSHETEQPVTISVRMIPERCVKVWTAEMVIALHKLHSQGITYGDLDMGNILLGDSGHILLSYRALWNEVDAKFSWNDFSAPEVINSMGKPLWKIHPSADWWSIGAILYFLLTGWTLQDIHPEGIMHPQTVVCVPSTNILGEPLRSEARSILLELLQYTPNLRLGYYGAEEIKSHPFFADFDWAAAESSVTTSS